MKIIISVLALSLLLFTQSSAWEQRTPLDPQSCHIHTPYGAAESTKESQTICREGYMVAYDSAAKIPLYVAYSLQPKNALGCVARTNAFVADKSIESSSK